MFRRIMTAISMAALVSLATAALAYTPVKPIGSVSVTNRTDIVCSQQQPPFSNCRQDRSYATLIRACTNSQPENSCGGRNIPFGLNKTKSVFAYNFLGFEDPVISMTTVLGQGRSGMVDHVQIGKNYFIVRSNCPSGVKPNECSINLTSQLPSVTTNELP